MNGTSLYPATTDRHGKEQVVSTYEYPPRYQPNRIDPIDHIMADLEMRAKRLNRLFGCGTSFNRDWVVRAHAVCPTWVEKFFLEPAWQKIDFIYTDATKKVFDLLQKTRRGRFCNYRPGQMGPDYLSQSALSVESMMALWQQQGGQNLVAVPAQFGLRHRGCSARRAEERFVRGEFGLGVFSTGTMLLTHRVRLRKSENLWVSCPGDYYDDKGSPIRQDLVPYFESSIFGLELDVRLRSEYDEYHGAVTGFVPSFT